MLNDPIDSSKTKPLDDVDADPVALIHLQQDDRRHDDMRMARIEKVLESLALTTAQNTTAIQSVKESTGEVVEIFTAMKGGVKVLGWLGQVLKWLTPIIAGYAAVRQLGTSSGWWPFR